MCPVTVAIHVPTSEVTRTVLDALAWPPELVAVTWTVKEPERAKTWATVAPPVVLLPSPNCHSKLLCEAVAFVPAENVN